MKPVALVLVAAAAAAAAAAALLPRSCGAKSMDPALPPATKADLSDLKRRVVATNRELHPNAKASKHEALLRKHDALLTEVESLGICTAADHDDLLPLYDHVALGISWRGDDDGGHSARAARMASLHQRLRRAHPERNYPPGSTRTWAQCCMEADDLQQLAAAIEFGKARRGGDPVEHVLLQVFEARLCCQLGRLENAGDLIAAAEASLLLAQEQQPAPSAKQIHDARVEIARAKADVCLLNRDPIGAETAIAQLPRDRNWRLYAALAAAMQQRPEAIAMLKALADDGRDKVARVALEKLVQLQLQLGMDDAALADLQRLLSGARPGAAATEERALILQMELAARGKLPIDEALLQAGRAALDRLLHRWRAAPAWRGGIGFLHLDDRATLVQSLMQVEAALSPTGPATAALATLLRVHAESAGLPAADVDTILPHYVGGDRGLLVMVPGRFRSLALCFDARGGTLIPLDADGSTLRDGAKRLHADAANLRQQTSPSDDDLARIARQGRSLLRAEVRRQLEPIASLTICGAGMLDGLPFDLVALGAEDVPCGLRHAIAYEDNLIAGARRAPAKQSAGVAFLGSLRANSGNTGPASMPADAVEACLLAHPKGPKRTVWCDHEATPASARSALQTRGLVHIVCHGRYAAARPDPNGLMFGDGPDEHLFASDLEGLDLSGTIVLLGACEVGNNPYRRGGDSMAPSVVGAMLRAGARCVLAATTEVDLFRHLESMAVLHQDMHAGRPIALAWLQTRQQARSTVARIELLLMRLQGRGD